MPGIMGWQWVAKRARPVESLFSYAAFDVLEEVRVNIARARATLSPPQMGVTPSNNLMRAAQTDANLWACHLPIIDSALVRAQMQYYTGEDAACIWGHGSIHVVEIYDAWLRDPATRAILQGEWNDVGVGVAGGTWNLHLVAYFGKRRSWPNEVEPVQEPTAVFMRDDLNFMALYPLSLEVGVG